MHLCQRPVAVLEHAVLVGFPHSGGAPDGEAVRSGLGKGRNESELVQGIVNEELLRGRSKLSSRACILKRNLTPNRSCLCRPCRKRQSPH